MTPVVVDSSVMRDKAQTLHTQATTIQTLYREMQSEVNDIASKMRGATISEAVARFNSMQPKFESVYTDINSYGTFLENAADEYATRENEGVQMAQQQGKIF